MKYLVLTVILFANSISLSKTDFELIDSVKETIEKFEFEQMGTPNVSRARYSQFGQTSSYKLDKSISFSKNEVRLDLFVYEFSDSKQASDSYDTIGFATKNWTES